MLLLHCIRLTLLLAVASSLPAAAAEGRASGIFLVAKRELQDPNFRETVVLVTQPRNGPPWGVIINRPLGYLLSEAFPEQELLKGRKDVLYFGGPVMRQALIFLVRGSDPPEKSTLVLRDVFFTGDVDFLNAVLKRRESARGVRVYSGHSGWGPDQLQGEIAGGSWYMLPADAETIFEMEPDRIWPELFKRAATKHTNTREIVRERGVEVRFPDITLACTPAL